jgi:uncharacterized repeat protein (TIGR01451 family)
MSNGWGTLDIVLSREKYKMDVGQTVDVDITIFVPDASQVALEIRLPYGLQFAASSIPPADMNEARTIIKWRKCEVISSPLTVSLQMVERIHGAILFIASDPNNEQHIKEKSLLIEASQEPYIITSLSLRNITADSQAADRLSYNPGDVVECTIHVKNTGTDSAMLLHVNHMIRDYLSYVPNSLQTDKGMGEVLFQLIRWHIQSLKSGEEARLTLHLKTKRDNPNPLTPIQATYTYQTDKHVMYGPYQSNLAVLEKK